MTLLRPLALSVLVAMQPVAALPVVYVCCPETGWTSVARSPTFQLLAV